MRHRRSRRLPSPRRLGPLLLGIVVLVAGGPVLALETSRSGPADLPEAGDRRRLPADLEPSLDEAPDIRPRAYEGGCHAEKGDRTPKLCQFGDEDGAFTVVLLGDSHALQWLPALEAIADLEGWKLYSMTKSACPIPDTPVIVRGERLRDCPPWRAAALELIGQMHPDLVVAASLGRIYELPRAGTPEKRWRLWRDAWTRSLEQLRAASDRVVLLGDTPMWQDDPIGCLRRHPNDIGRCDTPREVAVSARTEAAERDAAEAARVAWVPTADLVCPSDPCRAVEGRYLVLRDTQHMTVAWARSIGARLLERLSCGVAPGTTPGPVAAAPSAGPTAPPAPSVDASRQPDPTARPSSPSPSAGTWPSPSPPAVPADPSTGPGVSCQG